MTKIDQAPDGATILHLDDRYAVTPCGRVSSRAFTGGVKGQPRGTKARFSGKWKELSQATDGYGYKYVSLGKGNNWHVHSIVAAAFIGIRPDGMEVRHLDGNPSNNSVENLAYGTPKENGEDKARHGTAPRGTNQHLNVLSEAMAGELYLAAHSGYESTRDLAEIFGVSQRTVMDIKHGKSWSWLTNAN